MSIPKVSILMAVYNGMPYLTAALDSLLNQTLSDFELVVVDDASDDDTPNVLKEYARKDSRIVIVRKNHNIKLSASLNKGLKICRAPLIARADADDVYLPDRIAKQAEFMDQHPEIGVLGAAAQIIDEEGKFLGISRRPSNHATIKVELPFRIGVSHPSVMFRKEVILGVGGYDERFWTAQDYDLWARLISGTHFANLDEVLWHYRIRTDSIGKTRGEKGDRLARKVSQRLLSEYLEREISQSELESIVGIYGSRGKAKSDLIGIGITMFKEYLKKVKTREDKIVYRKLKQSIAYALLQQSAYQMPDSRMTGFRLVFFAFAINPGMIFSITGIKHLVRLVLPWRLLKMIQKSKSPGLISHNFVDTLPDNDK